MRWTRYAVACLSFVALAVPASARETTAFVDGWRFRFSPETALSEISTPAFTDTNWDNVALPHTWNAVDAQSIASSYVRGQGVYRKRFQSPDLTAGRQAWLEFKGVGMVADIWLNGARVGHHAGGFAAFRINITSALRPGINEIAVLADNTPAEDGTETSTVIPFAQDFNLLGGIYRDVALIVTGPVAIDLGDDGGAGSYLVRSTVTSAHAALSFRTRLRSAETTGRKVTLQITLRDAAGKIAGQTVVPVTTAPGKVEDIEQSLGIDAPHLWNGVQDPYLYTIQAAVLSEGRILDETTYPIGLRDIIVDADRGFVLNGKTIPLHGVAKHQDFFNKGWATSIEDRTRDMALIREIGANTVRLSHYQHDQSVYDLADQMGLIVYPELPLIDTPVPSDKMSQVPDAITTNARQQLRELIRQNQNHPSIAFWGIANEIAFVTRYAPSAEGAVDGLLEALRAEGRADDPMRPTIQANVGGHKSYSDADGIAALNRYYGWYDPDISQFSTAAQSWHRAHPTQPVALSEYGFGASITQHTDDPRVIQPENLVTIGRGAQPDFMPEEYQAYGHELAWKILSKERVFFATYVWNMIDFSSFGRQEGDYLRQGLSLNNKGLVTYDREIRKDAFYFYKAQWNPEPMLHLTGARYVDRSYPVTEVKAYTNLNTDKLSLSVNGQAIAGLPVCADMVCRWPEVRLRPGRNDIVIAGAGLHDQATWQLDDMTGAIRIRVGSFAPMVTANGAHFGSDTFLTAESFATSHITGNKRQISLADALRVAEALPRLRSVQDIGFAYKKAITVTPELFMNRREGRFAYDIPNPDGLHALTLSFYEPDAKASVGSRRFRIVINGRIVEPDFDIFQSAEGNANRAVVRHYTVDPAPRVSISFEPLAGEAVLSGLELGPA